jgi:hypothetical protein
MQYLVVGSDPFAAACRDILVMGVLAIALICLIGCIQFEVAGRIGPALASLPAKFQGGTQSLRNALLKNSRHPNRQRSRTAADLRRVHSSRELAILLPDLAEE